MSLFFERVTIAGVGLIGGSLALAAKKAGVFGEVVGLGRGEKNLKKAVERGIIDRYSLDPAEAADKANLLFLAVPVRSLAKVAQKCVPHLHPDAIVTDGGSVKGAVLREVAQLSPVINFVGAHPIAGSERAGAVAADVDLFQGHLCILTPESSSDTEAVEKVGELWRAVGMTVRSMPAERHDRILAWVSHLPHAISFAFVNAILGDDPSCHDFGGRSFDEMTRTAGSSVPSWTDIFLSNAEESERAITRHIQGLEEIRDAIADRDEAKLESLLESARNARLQWEKG